MIAQWCGERVFRQHSIPHVIGIYQTYSKRLAKTMSTTESDCFPTSHPPSQNTASRTIEQGSLSQRTYERRVATQTEHLEVRFVTNTLIALASTLFFLLLVLGIIFPYIGFQQNGLLATVDMRETEFSIISTVRTFSSNARFSSSPAIRFSTGLLSILLLAFVVVVPAIEYTCLLLLWFRSFSSASFSKCKAAADWCRIFGYIEIFAVTVVIAAKQITLIVQFLVGTNCEAAANFIGLAVDFGLVEQTDAFCYHVVGDVREASLFLLLAAFLQWSFRTFVDEAISTLQQQPQQLGFGSAAEEQTTATDHEPTTPTGATTPWNDQIITFSDRFRLLLVETPRSASSMDMLVELRDVAADE